MTKPLANHVVVYDADGVKITFDRQVGNMDNMQFVFDIENNTDKYISVDFTEAAISGYMISLLTADALISPMESGSVIAEAHDLKGNGIHKLGSIKTALDINFFDSEEAHQKYDYSDSVSAVIEFKVGVRPDYIEPKVTDGELLCNESGIVLRVVRVHTSNREDVTAQFYLENNTGKTLVFVDENTTADRADVLGGVYFLCFDGAKALFNVNLYKDELINGLPSEIAFDLNIFDVDYTAFGTLSVELQNLTWPTAE